MCQTVVQLLPSGIHSLVTGQLIEIVALDRVDETARLAVSGNEVVPAAGGHVLTAGQAGQACGNRVRSVKVVEQPAIQARVSQRVLHGGDVESHGLRQYTAL